MLSIKSSVLPEHALLQRYKALDGCYTDCLTIDVAGDVALSRYVSAFYTSPLFKLERLALSRALNRPSTDSEAHLLGNGEITDFAAWKVEGRDDQQLLMCDVSGRTRSWFMVEPVQGEQRTRLFFGSAVVPVRSKTGGRPSLGFIFHALLGFHKIYARALLWSAKKRL